MPHHFRKVAGAFAAMALAGGLALAGTGTARADVPVPVNTPVALYNPNLQAADLNTCVDDPFASTSAYTALWMWRCHIRADGPSQSWTFFPVVFDSNLQRQVYWVENRNANPQQCMGMDSRLAYAGFPDTYPKWNDASLVQEPCDSTLGALWYVIPATQSPDPAHQVQIVDYDYNPSLGEAPYCLAADNFRDTNGVRVVALPCSPYDSRQWWLFQ
jgi:hypothetical protein